MRWTVLLRVKSKIAVILLVNWAKDRTAAYYPTELNVRAFWTITIVIKCWCGLLVIEKTMKSDGGKVIHDKLHACYFVRSWSRISGIIKWLSTKKNEFRRFLLWMIAIHMLIRLTDFALQAIIYYHNLQMLTCCHHSANYHYHFMVIKWTKTGNSKLQKIPK